MIKNARKKEGLRGGTAYGAPRCLHSTSFARHSEWDRHPGWRQTSRQTLGQTYTDIEEEMNQVVEDGVKVIRMVIAKLKYKNLVLWIHRKLRN